MSSPTAPSYPREAPTLTPAELQKFEAPLIALANLSSGDLRKLFYAFFSFLHRRTDFYCIIPNDGTGGTSGGRMGFQEGQAEQILLASFRQFPLRKFGSKPGSVGRTGAKAGANARSEAKNSAVRVEVPTDAPPKVDNRSASVSGEESKAKITGDASADTGNDGKKGKSTKLSVKAEARRARNDTIRYTDEGKQIPVGNGGSTSRYVWTQTLDEVTVHIPIPDGLRAKNLDVKIGTNSFAVHLKKGAPSSATAFTSLEGALFARVKPSESTWTIESSTHLSQKMSYLQLTLDKVQKTWWATVMSGDTPLIDTTMVDSTRHIDTYDEETQAQIRRIMFDQRQERMGLPTSNQMMMGNLPPLPNGQQLCGAPLPDGVEYLDGETLDKANISTGK